MLSQSILFQEKSLNLKVQVLKNKDEASLIAMEWVHDVEHIMQILKSRDLIDSFTTKNKSPTLI